MTIPAQLGWLMVWTETSKYDGKEIRSVREDRVLAWSDDAESALVMTSNGPKWMAATPYADERYFEFGTEGQPVNVVPAPQGMTGYSKDDDTVYPVAFLGWADGTLHAYAVSNDAECGGTGGMSSGYGFFSVRVDADAVPKSD